MAEPFRSFVIFAGMRTGSNLLEATLNAVRRVTCFGEAFNPHMLGWPGTDEMLGVTRAARDADPMRLLDAIRGKPDHLPGFRYFRDHDPRVLDAILTDRTCAKIVLTRNPVDSHVSTLIARATDEWKLNHTETPTPAAVPFDLAAFRADLDAGGAFLRRIQSALQTTGQTAFWLGYDDLREAAVMTGLLHWLGRTDLERVEPAQDQVPQNPREMAERVTNFAAMRAGIAALDPFDLTALPGFEPRRGPAVPSYLASGAGRGLVFMPIRGGPADGVRRWLTSLGEVQGDFTQASLRHWKRDRPGHRGFTVLRAPVRRAWVAFQRLLAAGQPELREVLRSVHHVALPPDPELAGMDDAALAQRFGEFLVFLRRNLNGQTGLPTHPGWASQSELLAGFARLGSPDLIAREDTLAGDLGWLARTVGVIAPLPMPEVWPDLLDDPDLIAAARAAYLRDCVALGF